ncbi:MAG: OmpA family protein [Saprospiraceae bacterium]|nr:OmpA family protein [Saprospiraceae bacterium]
MNSKAKFILFFALCASLTSCVSKKSFTKAQEEWKASNDKLNQELGKCGESLSDYMKRLSACNQEKETLKGELKSAQGTVQARDEQVKDLKDQISDIRKQRDQTVQQVGDLTVLSQSASNNIKQTLQQLEGKDKYIKLLQAAKSQADSINLALAVNLKSVLKDGISDSDVEVKVDKTVVFINLSDKMLYQSGSANITSKANEVLGKIAKIVESRPDLEVMVEGYTDNMPIKNACIEDNWDLSVKRSTAVVRALQKNFKIDPNRLIAAGRGEYNTLASNDTADGRATNRRTRIIILPKLNQFYDLLNPKNVPD